MAYNPEYLSMISVDSGKNGPRVFGLRSTDNEATIEGAGYISDARDRGMRVGDAVLAQNVDDLAAPTTVQSDWKTCTAIDASTGAGTVASFVAIT